MLYFSYMSVQDILLVFKRYQAAGKRSVLRRSFLLGFESRMVYRTTKTENPETTRRLVDKVLQKMRRRV